MTDIQFTYLVNFLFIGMCTLSALLGFSTGMRRF